MRVGNQGVKPMAEPAENGGNQGAARVNTRETDRTMKITVVPGKSAGTEVNHTMVMASAHSAETHPDKDKRAAHKKNLSVRFSLEVFSKKGGGHHPGKEEVNEYFGTNLTRYIGIPIDNSPMILPDYLPELNNKYENLEVFNEGGQGIISVAKENSLGRIVALKTLKNNAPGPDGGVGDFITEAKVTAQLDHPSIIPIYAIGKNREGNLQLAMKLINGKTLREHLKNICLNYRMRGIGAFDERASLYKRLEIFLHVCDALEYAHHRKIMHCDLKPENVMIGEYREVYLMDWGLAKPIPDPNDLSEWVRPDTIAGTPRYLSPEAIVGDRTDQRADIFTMGLILQEITTLKYAVPGEDSSEVMNKIKENRLDPIVHQYGCRIDRDLQAVIEKATAYFPRDRYQTIRDLANDVRSYMQGTEVTANPDNFFMKTVRMMSRHGRTMLLIVFIALALVLGMLAFTVYRSLQQTREMSERSEMINRAYGKCFAATSLLDREILAQEKNLSLIAGLAGRILSSWTVHNPRIRFRIYDQSGQLPEPSDAVYSPWYKLKVSFSDGVCRAAPGVDPVLVKSRVEQLSPLVYSMRKILLESGSELAFMVDSQRDPRNVAIQNGLPVKSLYIGLKDGIQFGFPWRDIYGYGFDPRKRPWYIHGSKSSRPVWGNPYVGVDYHIGLCLPCSMSILDDQGGFHGVAGIELTFNKVADILHRSGNVGCFVLDSALIDDRGRIIASSDKRKQKKDLSAIAKNGRNTEVTMDFYAAPRIRHAILDQKFGIISDYEPGRGEVMYLFAQMKTLNWICVQKIDFEAYRTFFRRNQIMKKIMKAKELQSPGPDKPKY